MGFELGIVIKTILVLGCAGGLSFLMRRSSAAARHTVWAAGLWAALALPAASWLLPRVELPVLPASEANRTPAVVETAGPDIVDPVPLILPAANRQAMGSQAGIQPGFAIGESAAPVETGTVQESNPFRWALWIWGLGAVVVIARSLLGLMEIRKLRRRSRPFRDRDWQDAVAGLHRDLAVRNPVVLRIAIDALPPMTWGVCRHTILLPNEALSWSEERRRIVLAHELAHVKRNDGLTQMLAQVSCSIYWFNPLVWYAAYRIRIEREQACDDLVLSLGADAGAYADHLLQIARGLNSRRSFATVAMIQRSQFEQRLLSILDRRIARQALSRFTSAVLVGSLALLSASAAAIQLTTALPLGVPPARQASEPLQPGAELAPALPAAAPVLSPEAVVAVMNPLLAQEQPSGHIGGVVLDAAGDNPLDGVSVALTLSGSVAASTVLTGGDGRFDFPNLSPGTYQMTAARAGFRSPNTRQADPTVTLTIQAGERADNLWLYRVRSAAVSGRVFDEFGLPNASAAVYLMRMEYDSDGYPELAVAARATTDDTGAYRFIDAAPGRYFVMAMALGAPAFVPSYYPGVPYPDRAVAVTVPLNVSEIGGIDIRTDASERYNVRVRLISPEPLPANVAFSLRQRVEPRPGQSTIASRRLSDDTYEILGLYPGAYSIYIQLPGYVPPRRRVDVEVIDRDVDLGTFEIRLTSISGRVVLPSGMATTDLRIHLTPIPVDNGSPAIAVVQPDGSFALAGVREGRYKVSAMSTRSGFVRRNAEGQGSVLGLPPDYYIEAARYGGRDIYSEGLTVRYGEPTLPLEIVITGSTGSVQGAVRDRQGNPVPNVRAILAPPLAQRGNPDLFLSATANYNGTFSIAEVPPGEYTLFAWEYLAGDAFKNADFLRGYETRGTRVLVGAGAASFSDVTLIEIAP